MTETAKLGFPDMLIGYMRVSSVDERQSVDLQRDALVQAGVDERHIFQDKASGARDDRPGLKKCLSYIKSGDTLVVWKLDRLGRSLPHLLTIIEDLKAKSVSFRSLTEQMDTTTSHGELMFSLFGALAQYERALIHERVMAGLAAAKRRGRTGGRPPSISQERLDMALDYLNKGESKLSVARRLTIPRTTLLNTLERIGWQPPSESEEGDGDVDERPAENNEKKPLNRRRRQA
ncbi:recombinase family protein [Gluconobacter kondonii]